MAVATDLFLVLSPPGAIDMKGSLKNSIPTSVITPAGGVGENMFYGFNLSQNRVASLTALNIGTGTASLANGSTLYKATSASTIAVSILATGAGGLDIGPATTGWYIVWLIVNPTTNAVSALGSHSTSAPTMPAGYTLKRRIGSFYYNSALTPNQISDFIQTGSGPTKSYVRLDIAHVFPYSGSAPISNVALNLSPLAVTYYAFVIFTPGDSAPSSCLIEVGLDPGSSVTATVLPILHFSGATAAVSTLAPVLFTPKNGSVAYSMEAFNDPSTTLSIQPTGWTENL